MSDEYRFVSTLLYVNDFTFRDIAGSFFVCSTARKFNLSPKSRRPSEISDVITITLRDDIGEVA